MAAPFIVIIPARLASTRLPNKPLADLGGKPMVVRVAERAALAGASRIIVATDHADIRAACAQHGVEVCMTRADHPSGTDRIAEEARALALQGRVIGDRQHLERHLGQVARAYLAEHLLRIVPAAPVAGVQ